jgi:hypothetical protein
MPSRRGKRLSYPRQGKSTLILIMATMIGWWWAFSSSRTTLRDGGPPIKQLANPHSYLIDDGRWDHLCLATLASNPCQKTSDAWRDWTSCMQTYLVSTGWYAYPGQPYGAVADFIYRCRARLPWNLNSNHTAVLVEFRALEDKLQFSVNNIMWNLPIHWRLQIVGGPDMCRLAFRLFRDEVAADKIIITSLDYEKVEQVKAVHANPWRKGVPIASHPYTATNPQSQISQILTDKDGFYDRLKGDIWLFFQVRDAFASFV